MSNMEFCYANYLNTTTMVSITSGTTTVSNMFDRKRTTYYTTVGDNSDLTTTTIRIELSSAENINRLVLQDINWKGFRVYHSSNTANVLTLLNSPTVSSVWTGNSDTCMYLEFATVSASIITFEITTTMVANEEKEIGNLFILEKFYAFEDNPTAADYDPIIEYTNYNHKMSDGGSAVYFIQENFAATIKRKYVSSSEKTSLKSLYTQGTPFTFTPMPTGTSWDGDLWEVNWTGKFDFMQYTHNVKGNGFSGSIKLEETAK